VTRGLVLLPIAAPLLLAVMLIPRRTRQTALALMAWASLPALAASLLAPEGVELYPGLLMGARLGLDPIGRRFLGLTAVLWLAAGVYARAYPPTRADGARYAAFHLAALAGNVGLTLAHDIVSFQCFFALMGFAAYGLVVHDGTARALHAGRAYLAFVVLGEVAIFAGALMAWQGTGPIAPTAVALLVAGFAIKCGLVPLHGWLPLAHPAAPTPASAVLSGAMIKAGLLGWIRVLPMGAHPLMEAGLALVALGFGSAVYGALVGLLQREVKAVLAYSSVSQMGLIAVGVGAALVSPEGWPELGPGLLLLAMHHGVAKATLFLAAGLAAAKGALARAVAALGVVVPALALAGLPGTSGALAKSVLADGVARLPTLWAAAGAALLPLAAVLTTLLMARALAVTRWDDRTHTVAPAPSMWAAIVGLLVIGATAVAWLPRVTGATPPVGGLLKGAGPLALGVVIAVLVWSTSCHRHVPRPDVPPGDVLEILTRTMGMGWSAMRHVGRGLDDRATAARLRADERVGGATAQIVEWAVGVEVRLGGWPVAGPLFVLLAVALALLWLAPGAR